MKMYANPPTGNLVEFRHELKTWPDVFEEIHSGRKVHEFRKNDRDFRDGDLVLLREFEPAGERYTGREIPISIMSISYGPQWGIPKGYVAFSIQIGWRGNVVEVTDPYES